MSKRKDFTLLVQNNKSTEHAGRNDMIDSHDHDYMIHDSAFTMYNIKTKRGHSIQCSEKNKLHNFETRNHVLCGPAKGNSAQESILCQDLQKRLVDQGNE